MGMYLLGFVNGVIFGSAGFIFAVFFYFFKSHK